MALVMKKTDKKTEEQVEEQQTENTDELEDLKARLEVSEQNWRRAIADYQNLVKRSSEEKAQFARFAAKELIEKLLNIVDDLEKAQAHIGDKGLELALKKMFDLLQQEGVKRIDTKDKEYDFETMEALTVIEGQEDNKVVEELRAGYTMYGSVLRPAQVTVSKKQ